jgi:hexulose-6-phosphate isomerase
MTTRREFLLTAGAAVAAGGALAAQDKPTVRLKKAVKYGMVRVNGPAKEKFELLKRLGFQGTEIDSPSGLNLDELTAARDATGIVIHGVIDSVHWTDTLSHPSEAVRAKGLKALLGAIEDARKVGADTVLLVPGVVNKDVTYEQCWERSTAEVRKAIPDAEKAKVKIAVETVWNDFLTKPDQLVEYVDQFKSEWVGAYLDPGNMVRYGVPAGDWVKAVGKRLLKVDVKGYSRTIAREKKSDGAGFEAKIGDGDVDWAGMLKACAEVGYAGWATAEVRGGDEKWLADVSERMDKILQLK